MHMVPNSPLAQHEIGSKRGGGDRWMNGGDIGDANANVYCINVVFLFAGL